MDFVDTALSYLSAAWAVLVAWLARVANAFQAGEFASLGPLDWIILTIPVMVLIGFFVRVMLNEGEKDSGGYSVSYGAYSIHNKRPEFEAEKRKRNWQKKLMTPAQQQVYVDRVQREELAKTAKRREKRKPPSWKRKKWVRQFGRGWTRNRILITLVVIAIPVGGAISMESACYLSRHTDWVKPIQVRQGWQVKYGDAGPWQDATAHQECVLELRERLKQWIGGKWQGIKGSLEGFFEAERPIPVVSTNSTDKADPVDRRGTHKVVSVVDGDTVYLRASGDQIKVRLVCIDAPESSQAYGKASKNHLARLIGGQYVQLEDRGQDRYGRTLGLIRANGYDMNWQMIKDGYAWDYDRYTCGRSYQKAEKVAREAQRGLWAAPNPQPPWEFRRR